RTLRTPPARAAGALLPHGRVVRGLGGPCPGDVRARLAGAGAVQARGAVVAPSLAVSHRDERVSRPRGTARPAGAAGERRARGRSRGRRPAHRRGRAVARAVSRSIGGPARRGGRTRDPRDRVRGSDPAPSAAAAGGADPARPGWVLGTRD